MLFTTRQRDERLFRKGLELGFERAKQAVKSITILESPTFDESYVIRKINDYRVMTLSMPDSFVDRYIGDPHDETEPSGINVYPVGLFRDIRNFGRFRYGLRYLIGTITRKEWQATRNYFNGYLAEWNYPSPEMQSLKAGRGWTKKAAVKRLGIMIAEANLLK